MNLQYGNMLLLSGMCQSSVFINGFMSAAMCALEKFCASVCVFMRSSSMHVCVCRAISKEANSLVDRNCYGLEVEPLAAVMQVEPQKPHQSQQQYNEAELLNGAMPATMQLLLLPQQRQAQLRWQHGESQTRSVRQTRRTGARSSQLWSVFIRGGSCTHCTLILLLKYVIMWVHYSDFLQWKHCNVFFSH